MAFKYRQISLNDTFSDWIPFRPHPSEKYSYPYRFLTYHSSFHL